MPVIGFDVTKVSGQRHRSGLTRVSERLRGELAAVPDVALREVVWHARRRTWIGRDTGRPMVLRDGEWILTPELFSEEERPGFTAWLSGNGARAAAIYHDAIPLRFPSITWPQSVARHPEYMQLLASFGRVLAVSEASARELTGYWAWSGVTDGPPVQPIMLGADGHGAPRAASPSSARRHLHEVLMVGIVEPRKNQDAVLDAVAQLAAEGVRCSVRFVGRVNPHFGRATEKRIRNMARAGLDVVHEASLDDEGLRRHVANARFALVPSRAEGCGLPVLESLWAGLPVLATALPSIVESARGGGCMLVAPDDAAALIAAMRVLLTNDQEIERLANEACARTLPRWSDTAHAVAQALAK